MSSVVIRPGIFRSSHLPDNRRDFLLFSDPMDALGGEPLAQTSQEEDC
jgi:hypothetical protein